MTIAEKREAVMSELRARTQKSGQLYTEALKTTPAGVMSRGRQIPPYPFTVDRAQGSRLWDVDGNEYVDCAMSYGAAVLGHRPQVVVEAVKQAVARYTNLAMPTEISYCLARLIQQAVPCAERVTLCNSGTEATMHALRIARANTGRKLIAKFEGGYHGDHDYVLASCFLHDPDTLGPVAEPKLQSDSIGIPQETLSNTLLLPFNHQHTFDLIQQHKDQIALVLVEGLQSAGGCVCAEGEWLKELREVTRQCNVWLLFDEVFTGFRLALGGAQEWFGVVPDMATYAKAVGGGLPVGAIAGLEKVMKTIDYTGEHSDFQTHAHYGGTFNGNVVAVAAGEACIRYLMEHPEVYQTINTKGHRIREEVNRFIQEHNLCAQMIGAGSIFYTHFTDQPIVRCRDLLTVDVEKQQLFFLCLVKHGIFIPNMHLGMIGAAHSEADVDFVIEVHKRALQEVEGF